MALLEKINGPRDLKALLVEQLPFLAGEMREFMVNSVSKTGGHLASSLGAVELTLALHYVFDSPKDKIIFDVGHQAYAHKMLTGRQAGFAKLRQHHGLSGFPKRFESEHDVFDTGHSSTSISAGLGMAVAAHLQGDDDAWHIAVIGDGALTGGMAIEALNHAGTYQDGMKLLVIVNDNDCSISPSVGALNHHLAKLVSGSTFMGARDAGKRALKHIPALWNFFKRMEQRTVNFVAPDSTLFSAYDLNYYGPVNGHDVVSLVEVLQNIKKLDGPMVLHISTVKGKGYRPAEENPTLYHGVGTFDPKRGIATKSDDPKHPTYTQVFSRWICDMARIDPKLYAITPAMREGSGLVEFEKQFPERYHDVAIAEQHAVTYAAGLAANGMHPVVALYSTFAQRAYDQILHDVAIQKLPVTFAIDRGGLVGADGETHHGVFDLAFLRSIPNMCVMAPSDEDECRKMLTTAVRMNAPAAVRYPRGKGPGVEQTEALETIEIGRARVMREGSRVALLGFGLMVDRLKSVAQALDATLVDMRFVKPIDEAMIEAMAKSHDLIVTAEDGVLMGGAGSAVLEVLSKKGLRTDVLMLGLPDEFISQGETEELFADYGLTPLAMEMRIRERLGERVVKIEENVDLKPHNTMSVAAKARYFVRIDSIETLKAALDWAKSHDVKPFVLGGGANLLMTSTTIDRLVMKMEIAGFELVGESSDAYFVKIGAGEDWHTTLLRLIEAGWPGMENLALIPGTVGASVVQNIGAYGAEVAQFVKEVEIYVPENDTVDTLLGKHCDFAYRHSIFKTPQASSAIVLSVTFALPKKWEANLCYKDLVHEVEKAGEVTPKTVLEAVVAVRSRKLPDPKELGSAGSFFKNPVVDHETYVSILERFPSVVHYPMGGGKEKLAAGWMIDQCGLKGYRDGDAGTYEKQALVLVNHGSATGAQLWQTALMIQNRVHEQFGVMLEPEPVILDR